MRKTLTRNRIEKYQWPEGSISIGDTLQQT